ncbi:hypothetical protein HanPSC8_Chr14g0620061 [Helianthus annuus]|nr:hypothetical protein HanPSC8_Chr14g0620061 [Helianthus annuus]
MWLDIVSPNQVKLLAKGLTFRIMIMVHDHVFDLGAIMLESLSTTFRKPQFLSRNARIEKH